MYKLLVVDDEPRHLRGLANMIRKLRKDYTVLEAGDGKKALEIATKNNVDIIITDIQMPVMDGLQLIEQLGEKIRDVCVVILSVHGNFEYARKAIQLGAFDYLLKPVDENKIFEMLEKVERKITQMQMEKQEKERLKAQLNNIFPDYLEHLLNKWVNGTIHKSEINKIKEHISLVEYGYAAVVEIGNGSFINDENKIETNELCFSVKCRLSEVISTLGDSVLFTLEEHEDTIVIILNSGCGFSFEQIINKLTDVIHDTKAINNATISMGIGEKFADSLIGVKESFNQARAALSYKFYMDCGKIMTFADISGSLQYRAANTNKEEEALKEALKRLDKAQLVNCLDLYINKLADGKLLPPPLLVETVTNRVLSIISSYQDIIPEAQYKELLSDIKIKLTGCSFYNRFLEDLKGLLLQVVDVLKYLKENRNELVMEKCLDYIQIHFDESLSLENIAEMYYFNPSYFSTLFRSYTGVTFSQYLLKLRMKKAMELLVGSDFKVYKIAKKIGYEDANYFNRVFKKEYGMSPDEYRKIVSGM